MTSVPLGRLVDEKLLPWEEEPEAFLVSDTSASGADEARSTGGVFSGRWYSQQFMSSKKGHVIAPKPVSVSYTHLTLPTKA